ncbi:hypothetical protein FDA94_28865 [Herbidospora galbida]|uniref:NYN domain-containing protein n=1 Tax=Herbidospora galbida TaxID=2575442 RepID=A0A4U3M9A9_9ACTN|nr:hypothetical protein [Herbidospora galbida]TKK84644.1 hypothetical protein FDA94_28865 [Herbidospora galbida]
MSRHIALVLDGILRDTLTGLPDDDGKALYNALVNNYRVTILADHDKSFTTSWLTREGFHRHANVTYNPTPDIDRLQQIRTLRATGALDLVVIGDPSLAHPLFSIGQSHLLWINPRAYTPLPPAPQWAELVAAIEADHDRALAHLPDEIEDS